MTSFNSFLTPRIHQTPPNQWIEEEPNRNPCISELAVFVFEQAMRFLSPKSVMYIYITSSGDKNYIYIYEIICVYIHTHVYINMDK